MIVLTAACASSASAQPSGGPPPAKVYVDEARTERVEIHREVTGELRPLRRAVVASQGEGVVASMDLDEGDTVEAGEALARLDADLIERDLARAEAQVEADKGLVREREAELENARRDLQRLEELETRGSARPVELDDARTDVAAIEARLAQAKAALAANEAALKRAERELENMTIRAPFGGRVVSIATELGEWISEGGAVLELLQLDRVECWLDVPERYIEALRTTEDPVRIRVEALGEFFEAPIAGIVPDADPLARLFPVRVVLENPEGRLSPGMSVLGLVPTGATGEALTIHRDAIRLDEAGEFVYFDQNGSAGIARVQPLYTVGDRAVIRPGPVRAGQRLIVEGNERLFPGQPLEVMGGGEPGEAAGGDGEEG